MTTKKHSIKIGTRGSKLALIQAQIVADALEGAHDGLGVEIVDITTSGDWKPEHGETRLSEVDGGKGLFAKEIERAILDGTVDCGVHSMKDMPSFLPDGLVIEHILEREDPRDAFLSEKYETLDDMPEGATIGTSSLRRQAFVLAKRSDLKIVPVRGNVPTRIEKMKNGQADAIILAYSGLKRLGLDDEAQEVWEPDFMLPAAGQGAIGIEIRADDQIMRDYFSPLHHEETGLCVTAERAALQMLDGSCHTPIGAYAIWAKGPMTLRVIVSSEDGQDVYEEEKTVLVENTEDAKMLGTFVGGMLKSRVPPALLAA